MAATIDWPLAAVAISLILATLAGFVVHAWRSVCTLEVERDIKEIQRDINEGRLAYLQSALRSQLETEKKVLGQALASGRASGDNGCEQRSLRQGDIIGANAQADLQFPPISIADCSAKLSGLELQR